MRNYDWTRCIKQLFFIELIFFKVMFECQKLENN